MTTTEIPPPAGGPPAAPPAAPPAGEEVTIDEGQLAEAIKKVLPDVLKGQQPAPGAPGAPAAPPAGGGTLRAQEASVEAIVRSELERTTKEKERDDRLTKLEKVVEKAPLRHRLSTKLMGWVGPND